jgi:type VI secretion system secreted protein VgrG
MARFKQEHRLLSATTPLGEDVLLLAAFRGREELSRLFRYELEFLSEKDDIAAKDIIGQGVTWAVQPADSPPRFFHGVVSRFMAGPRHIQNLRCYRAEVVPWLWFLTRSADCRIFQNKEVPAILKQVFQDQGFTDHDFQLRRSYPKREYCVQYRETAFNFVSRLMEEEGIFYSFRHGKGKHTLVLADQTSAYAACPESRVVYTEGSHPAGHVTRWEHQYAFRSGKWAQTDYNFETPETNLLASTNTLVKWPRVEKFELFDYPGAYDEAEEGKAKVKIRMEEEEMPHDVVEGAGGCYTFTPGAKFTLEKHDCETESGKGYVLTAVEHRGQDFGYTNTDEPAEYENAFTCIPDAVTFRPARLTHRPVVQGPQTAVVVGKQGEEIFTDRYGRVKVQFFWDRQGKKDENSSCWIRVAENWAGKNWGMVFHPRVGQEVVVDFLEGDPDRPLITGRVYNAGQMPPYELPKQQTVSGIKTRSTKGGSAEQFNELRFEDLKDKEDIYFHAQKDFHRVVENDDDLKVGHDQTIEIKNNRTEVIKEGDEKLTLEQGQRTHQIKKDDTLKVDGGRSVTVKQKHAVTVSQGDYSVDVKLGSVTIQAMKEITLKVGQNSIVISQQGINLKGISVKIEGQAMAEMNGAMAKVQAQAILQMKGALTQIG